MDKEMPIGATILETYIQSKTGNLEDCEDRIHISAHFIAVIDGATSKTDDRWDHQTSGQKAAEIVDATLSRMPRQVNSRQAADRLTAAIRAFYQRHQFESQLVANPERRITASVVIVSLFQRQIWSIGDCQFMLGERGFTVSKKVDEVAEVARAFILESEIIAQQRTIAELMAHDPGRDFIQPVLERQYCFQNHAHGSPFDYAAVDGFPIPPGGVVVEPIPDDVNHVVLASDGYPVLRPNLAESEQRLAELLQRDPLLFREYKSTKGLMPGHVSFDDRAYVKIQL